MKHFFRIAIIFLLFNACQSKTAEYTKSQPATLLIEQLKNASSKAILFGHQDDLAYGIGWKGIPGQSDVKRVAGDYPAIFGWEIGNIGDETNLDGVNFDSMVVYIQLAHQMGGMNTLSWHARYPVTNTDSWSRNNIDVSAILPGGAYHYLFLKRLDLVAQFISRLRDEKGDLIPILFRPWHEMLGNWFWWGTNTCSNEAYIALYRFTVDYLQKEKKLNNLLWVYSANGGFTDKEFYLSRYPGDEYIDVLGIDNYGDFTRNRLDIVVRQIEMLVDLSKEKDKIPAFTETGSDKLAIQNWYTTNLLQVLKASEKTRSLAYVMVWRNRDIDHFYVPYPEHEQADDFKDFVNDKMIYLLNDYYQLKK